MRALLLAAALADTLKFTHPCFNSINNQDCLPGIQPEAGLCCTFLWGVPNFENKPWVIQVKENPIPCSKDYFVIYPTFWYKYYFITEFDLAMNQSCPSDTLVPVVRLNLIKGTK